MGWLLMNVPAIVSAIAGLSNAADGIAHKVIQAKTGNDHAIVLDEINAAIASVEGHLSALKAIAGSASAPGQEGTINP